MPLKLLVIHSTSLVGKSTIVASLLHPRLNAPRVFSVEKQNQDAARYGIEVVRYRVPDFKQLMEDILLETHDLIVDVGASQYADMMKEFARLRGAINDFDVVIVPTTPDGRVQEETLTTIEAHSFVQLPHAVQHAGRALYPPVLRPEQIAHPPTYSASSKSLFHRRSFDLSDFSFVYVVIPGTGRHVALGKGFALPLCPIVVRFTVSEKKRACARLRFSK